jgi:hypothetical protein
LKARKPDSHTVIFPNSIPVTVLRPEVKEAVVSILSKGIYFNSPTNSNGRALVEVYIVVFRRFKDEVKAGLNIEKLLTIIMSI